MKKLLLLLSLSFTATVCFAQLRWQNLDSAYGSLPSSVHVFYTEQAIDTAPFRAFYLIADLKDRHLDFTTDTTLSRRLTPAKFYEKNNSPLVVVNGTFFSFETNRNLNAVIKEGKLVSYNVHDVGGRGKDTLTYRHPFTSAIGIDRKGHADVAWLFADSTEKNAYAMQSPQDAIKDSAKHHDLEFYTQATSVVLHSASIPSLKKWKVKTAIGGGPSLIWNGQVRITNNEEMKFAGKAITDKHPRTAMGYTADDKLIILVVEGRNKVAHGATLEQEAQILKDLGCAEALNLDGGGSSCLLVNGKETIKVADATGQRPVPAVFLIKRK